ncbi:MAG: hypothetical protein GFH27_549281n363 [Chloroflexi bacterium AL-W]|nr:hypothetical protein [Chloroflexi bacterium AL-N1]NOK66249.1 hypothetical protein [Chloroflexi bacterium AL-N10]NOK73129.1 hypothetical protein [Chloroflexi bacterium AL-N5]NOK80026.1 hypothetical protein [Chloroflexi bacterium AL-W]NOK88118.1 hypothetical protein [Chloroflexi bacterium AL-N15]
MIGTESPAPSFDDWHNLDQQIRQWWDTDVHTAFEEDIRADEEQTLLFLPYPYSSAGGAEKAFPEMYGWDTFFINCALLAHNRADLVRGHILNQLYQIERFGMVLNGNRTYYRTRSQAPLLAESLRRYIQQHDDHHLLMRAYPLLKHEYQHYWNAPHHQTPTDLATNRDIGDTDQPRLHAESEALDFFAGYGGEVRHCVPLLTNCLLVAYADNLGWLARRLCLEDEALHWQALARERAARIQHYCWNDHYGMFLEYNFVEGQQIPVFSLCTYLAMWAGIATQDQAYALVRQLTRFQHPYGLAMTDQMYPSPHPEFSWVQWNYPAGWPPFHIFVVEALERYGFMTETRKVAAPFLGLMTRLFQETGSLWEKYNVVEGSLSFPLERYNVPPLHGWSSAAIVLLGRQLFS